MNEAWGEKVTVVLHHVPEDEDFEAVTTMWIA
jgi:hypothetical protein